MIHWVWNAWLQQRIKHYKNAIKKPVTENCQVLQDVLFLVHVIFYQQSSARFYSAIFWFTDTNTSLRHLDAPAGQFVTVSVQNLRARLLQCDLQLVVQQNLSDALFELELLGKL